MTTTTQVPLVRIGHGDYQPLIPGVATTSAARCKCGATWAVHPNDPRHPTFTTWAMTHLGPRCAGSGQLVHDAACTHGQAKCPACGLFYGTAVAAGYEGWRYLVTHIVEVG